MDPVPWEKFAKFVPPKWRWNGRVPQATASSLGGKMIDYIFTHLWLYISLCALGVVGLMALVAALDDAGQAMVGETIKRRVERKTREGYYDK